MSNVKINTLIHITTSISVNILKLTMLHFCFVINDINKYMKFVFLQCHYIIIIIIKMISDIMNDLRK